MVLGGTLPAGAVAVLAPRPAAGPALAFLQLLLRSPNAALSGPVLLGILDPADELVAGQRRDVLPGTECRAVGDQRFTQVRGQLMHHPTGHSLGAHSPMVVSRGQARFTIRLWYACGDILALGGACPSSPEQAVAAGRTVCTRPSTR